MSCLEGRATSRAGAGSRGPGLASEIMGALRDDPWEPRAQGDLWPAADDLHQICSFMLLDNRKTDPSRSNTLSPSVDSNSGHLCFLVGRGASASLVQVCGSECEASLQQTWPRVGVQGTNHAGRGRYMHV